MIYSRYCLEDGTELKIFIHRPSFCRSAVFIFLSNLFIKFDVKLLTNPGKLSLAKGTAIFVSAFFS